MIYLYWMKWMVTLLFFILLQGVASAQDLPRWKVTDIEKYILEQHDKVLVINFWATFCKPCVAEIPHFISITDKRKSDSVRLLLVSLDLPSYFPKKIQSFAKKYRLDAPLAWLDETNADYFCPKIDPSWSGSIPATLFINSSKGYRHFVEDELDAEHFEEELNNAIQGKR